MKKLIIFSLMMLIISLMGMSQPALINKDANIIINEGTGLNMSGSGFVFTNQSNATLNVNGMVTVDGSVINDGQINLSNTGSFIDGGSISGSGNATIHLFLSGNDAHYVSQPVQFSDMNIFSGGFVFSYDEATAQWVPGQSGNTTSIMKGYSVEFIADAEIEYLGTLNTGAQTIAVSALGGGWNLVGNPYPSAINWDASGWVKTNVDNAIYFWNGTNYSYYVGPGGTPPDQGPLYVNNGTNIIPAMQGFFVKASATGQLGTSNDVRLHNEQEFYKINELINVLMLSASGNGHTDETLVCVNQQATPEYDGLYDAQKLFTTVDNVPQLFSITNTDNTPLAINNLPSLNPESTIDLGFKAGVEGNYNINLNQFDLNDIEEIYLEDKKTGQYQNMKEDGSYYFNHQLDNPADRFILHFQKPAALGLDDTNTGMNIYCHDKTLYVQLNGFEINNKATLQVLDLSGKVLITNEVSPLIEKHTVDVSHLDGIYLVNIRSNNTTQVKQIAIK
jgi:hypothetical protein